MKRFPRTRATAKVGVAFVSNVVFEAGSIFREVPGETDLGIDGYIEFVQNEVPVGVLVGAQIKAGASYLLHRRDAEQFEVRVTQKDLHYWNVHPIPIALIVYDPTTKLSGWLDVTGYIRRNPEALSREQTTLIIDARGRPFTVDTFQGEFKTVFQEYKLEADLFDAADLMASTVPDDQLRGFLALLNCHRSRFSRLTCFLLLNHLFSPNTRLRAAVTDALSRYLPHPEIGFVPTPDIRNYVESALREFARYEVGQLLETAWLDEENLMQRGSLGQCAGVIITAIPEYERHLCEIAMDPTQSYEVRVAAMALASEFGMYDVIKRIARNLDRIEWGDVQEAAGFLAEESLQIEVAESPLSDIIERHGYDADLLANILRDASVYFLIQNEAIIAQISSESTNSIVRFEANNALNRAKEWQHPPDQHGRRML